MAGFIAGVGEIERKMMVTYIDVSDSETSSWEAVGVKVEDSSIEYNADIEKLTDILGITYTTFNKTEPQQAFEPFTVRKESKLAEKLFEIMLKKDYTKLQTFKAMTAYGFHGADGAFTAEVQDNCTIEVQSLGGSSRVDMPIIVHFSNDAVFGTVNQLLPASTVVFTEQSGTEPAKLKV